MLTIKVFSPPSFRLMMLHRQRDVDSVIFAWPASLASFNKENHDFFFRGPNFPKPYQKRPQKGPWESQCKNKVNMEGTKLRYRSGQVQRIMLNSWITPCLRPPLSTISFMSRLYLLFHMNQFGLGFCLLQKQNACWPVWRAVSNPGLKGAHEALGS